MMLTDVKNVNEDSKILFTTSADHVCKSGLNRASYIMGTGESTNQNKSNIKYKKKEEWKFLSNHQKSHK